MEETQVFYETVLMIRNGIYTFNYIKEFDIIELSYLDIEDDEQTLIIYQDGWHLDDSPFTDIILLEKYLDLFKRTII